MFLNADGVFPIESDTFDFVYSEHLFEHLKVEQQLNMLVESYRILKKSGIIRIATPNLDFLCTIYSDPYTPVHIDDINHSVNNYTCLKSVYNSIIDKEEYYNYVINNFFKAWGHQMIHNFTSIKKLALPCNYANVRECKVL